MVQVGSVYHKILIDSNRLNPPKPSSDGSIRCMNKRILGSIPLPFFKGENGRTKDGYELIPLDELHLAYKQLDNLFLVDSHPMDSAIKTPLGRNTICGNIKNSNCMGQWVYGDLIINTNRGVACITKQDKIFTSIAYQCYRIELDEPYMWSDDLGYFGKPGAKIPIVAFHRKLKLLHLGMTPYPRATALTVLNSISPNKSTVHYPNLEILNAMNPELEAIANGLTSVCNYLKEHKEQLSTNPLFQGEEQRNAYLEGIVNNCIKNIPVSNSSEEEEEDPEMDTAENNVNSTIDSNALLQLVANSINAGTKATNKQESTISELAENWKI